MQNDRDARTDDGHDNTTRNSETIYAKLSAILERNERICWCAFSGVVIACTRRYYIGKLMVDLYAF